MAAILVRNMVEGSQASTLDPRAGLPRVNGLNVPIPKVRKI